MASAANQEAFERQLSNSLSRVIDFLKFAEAKNAALLTFSSAWTVATVNFLLGTRPLPVGMSQALSISLCLFVAAALVAIGSFLPRRKLEIFHRDSNQEKNLLFYGHIATFEVGAYRERVRQRYAAPDEATAISENYLDDLIVQLAVNSKIADRKFVLFNIGAVIVAIAIVVLVSPIVIAGGRELATLWGV